MGGNTQSQRCPGQQGPTGTAKSHRVISRRTALTESMGQVSNPPAGNSPAGCSPCRGSCSQPASASQARHAPPVRRRLFEVMIVARVLGSADGHDKPTVALVHERTDVRAYARTGAADLFYDRIEVLLKLRGSRARSCRRRATSLAMSKILTKRPILDVFRQGWKRAWMHGLRRDRFPGYFARTLLFVDIGWFRCGILGVASRVRSGSHPARRPWARQFPAEEA